MITPVCASLMVKVITNTEVDEKKKKAQLKIICNKGYMKPVCKKQSLRLVSTMTTFPTILLRLLSVEIEQRNAANPQSKHRHRKKHGVITGDCRSDDFQTTSLSPHPPVIRL